MSQSGWFRVAEVKAVAKRGVKTFPVYLRLLLSATVTGGLTVNHRRRRVSQGLRKEEANTPAAPEPPQGSRFQMSGPLSSKRVPQSVGDFPTMGKRHSHTPGRFGRGANPSMVWLRALSPPFASKGGGLSRENNTPGC